MRPSGRDRSRRVRGRPGDAGGLVGDGHGDHSRRFALKQPSYPGPRRRCVAADTSHYRCGAEDQQPAQVTIAPLRYSAQAIFAAGRVLARNQTQKGGELATGLEDVGVWNTGGQGRGGGDADAGDGLETPTGFIRAVPEHELAFEIADLAGKVVELRGQAFDNGKGDPRQSRHFPGPYLPDQG